MPSAARIGAGITSRPPAPSSTVCWMEARSCGAAKDGPSSENPDGFRVFALRWRIEKKWQLIPVMSIEGHCAILQFISVLLRRFPSQHLKCHVRRQIEQLQQRPCRAARMALALLPIAHRLDRHTDAGGELGLGQARLRAYPAGVA